MTDELRTADFPAVKAANAIARAKLKEYQEMMTDELPPMDNLIKRLRNVTELVAFAGLNRCSATISEAADALAAQAAEIARLTADLQFVERWANHHGMKPHVTPQEALSTIQHYPAIVEITRSYVDDR